MVTKSVSTTAAKRLSAYRLQAGDLVIGRRGEMGRCAAVTERESGWLCGTGSFFVRAGCRKTAEILASILRSRASIEKLTAIASGATMLNLSNTALAKMDFSMPSSNNVDTLLERLAALTDAKSDLTSRYVQQRSDLTSLRQALLHKAFSGQLI
ncbi:restriction endonuclease subunit S [uncultured Abyssibacter sp.]|uniref:restriction endonuclease subunit S n=1 Tax=uncultured Abyssibacter sp. TaxID=2320202 RepID=UPI0032B218EF